jgi:radical SAM protein with 4Fe4S-binding SPASM domain
MSKYSKFSQLIISMDSVFEETYSKIRRGGNHKLMMENFEKLMACREEKLPNVIPQIIVMEENWREVGEFVDKVSEIGRKYGVEFEVTGSRYNIKGDTIYIRPLLFDEEWVGNKNKIEKWNFLYEKWKYWVEKYSDAQINGDIIKKESADPRNKPSGVCSSIFDGVVVDSSGKIVPCCGDYFEELAMGDLNYEPFEKIWCGKKYMELRRIHIEGEKKDLPQKCQKCYLPAEARISSREAKMKFTNLKRGCISEKIL